MGVFILIVLLIFGFIVPKIFPYMNFWLYVIILIGINIFCFVIKDAGAILVTCIFDIGFGFEALKELINHIGKKNTERYYKKKQRNNENNKLQ